RRPSCLYLLLFGAVTGEREKHDVEAGPGQTDVVDVDVTVAQPARNANHVGQAFRRRGELAGTGVDKHLGARLAQQGLRGGEVVGVGDGDDQAGVARELHWRALGDDAALVDHHDV